MPTLPSNVNYGQVVGQLLEAWGDGAINPGDADVLPDAKACTGTVRFTAKPTYIVDATATPNPVTFFPKVVTCKLDSNGYLLDPDGNQGVYLVADDDPDLNPTGWTWNASFNLNGIPQFDRDFSVGVGAVVDLSDILANSIPSSGGTGTIVTPSAVIDVVGRSGHVTGTQIAADPALTGTYASFIGLAKVPDQIITGSITRDANEVVTSAAVVWPDGTTGTFTATTIGPLNTIDAYTITRVISGVTHTYTQSAITRDASGAATSVPAITYV